MSKPFTVKYERCHGPGLGPQPGAVALMNWALTEYPPGSNLGIYNPRPIRGGSSWSIHACGRAIDVGFPVIQPEGHPSGTMLALKLVEHHRHLGVQQVIWAGHIWRNTLDHRGWRQYSGQSAHFDHVHAELTTAAAARLTMPMIYEVTGEAMTVSQIEAMFTVRLVQLYEFTGPNCRFPSVKDVQDWTAHLRAEGHDQADDILAGMESLLLNETPS